MKTTKLLFTFNLFSMPRKKPLNPYWQYARIMYLSMLTMEEEFDDIVLNDIIYDSPELKKIGVPTAATMYRVATLGKLSEAISYYHIDAGSNNLVIGLRVPFAQPSLSGQRLDSWFGYMKAQIKEALNIENNYYQQFCINIREHGPEGLGREVYLGHGERPYLFKLTDDFVEV